MIDRLERVDRRRLRRAAYVAAMIGSVLVIVAIPTDSAWIVGVGASLIVIAHILIFLNDFIPFMKRRALDSTRGQDPSGDQRFRSYWP